jgi:hypothetical protein
MRYVLVRPMLEPGREKLNAVGKFAAFLGGQVSA